MRDPKNGLKNMLGTTLTWPTTEKIDLNKVFQSFDSGRGTKKVIWFVILHFLIKIKINFKMIVMLKAFECVMMLDITNVIFM